MSEWSEAMSNSKAKPVTVKLKHVIYVLGHSKQAMRFFTAKDIVRSPCIATALVSPDSITRCWLTIPLRLYALVCTHLLHKAEIKKLLSQLALKLKCQELRAELRTTRADTPAALLLLLQATKAPNQPLSKHWRKDVEQLQATVEVQSKSHSAYNKWILMLWGENRGKWKSWQSLHGSRTQDTSGLSRQCSATEPQQPDNHQPSQSSVCTTECPSRMHTWQPLFYFPLFSPHNI